MFACTGSAQIKKSAVLNLFGINVTKGNKKFKMAAGLHEAPSGDRFLHIAMLAGLPVLWFYGRTLLNFVTIFQETGTVLRGTAEQV